jgi:hypothetical protein
MLRNEHNVMQMYSGGGDGGRENPYATTGWKAEGKVRQTRGGDATVTFVPGGGSDPGLCGAEHKGLAEADRGDFASESEVKRVAKKRVRRAR